MWQSKISALSMQMVASAACSKDVSTGGIETQLSDNTISRKKYRDMGHVHYAGHNVSQRQTASFRRGSVKLGFSFQTHAILISVAGAPNAD